MLIKNKLFFLAFAEVLKMLKKMTHDKLPYNLDTHLKKYGSSGITIFDNPKKKFCWFNAGKLNELLPQTL